VAPRAPLVPIGLPLLGEAVLAQPDHVEFVLVADGLYAKELERLVDRHRRRGARRSLAADHLVATVPKPLPKPAAVVGW